MKKSKKVPLLRRFISWQFSGFFFAILIALIPFYYYILKDLPSPTVLTSNNLPQSTQIFDRNGKLLYTIYGKKNQTFVPLSSIPKQVQQATIAVEDKDFYKHGPIDFRGIARAFVVTIFHRQTQGGSTITQQLVKNSLLTPERTVLRKVKEIILSFATEVIYPKDKILEMYLNQTPYGGTSWGIEAAAQTYFGKHAHDLTIAESSLLAGLPEAPTTFSPFGAHPELAKYRQLIVLNDMYQQGYITKQELYTASNELLHYQKFSNTINAPHFVLYVKDLLIKKYGEKVVEQGGLKVETSLDLTLQEYVQASVAGEVTQLKAYHVTNGAALVTKPGTGEILAMVGSRNYFDPNIDGNVNITLAHRQPGSSIKPVNYVVGLIKNYTAATPFVDQPTCFPTLEQKQYCPVNYDGNWHGVVQMRYALGNSINMPAVKQLKLNGIDAMLATASAMGITTLNQPERYGLSLTLGGGEVTMLDMATAYGVFANEGYRIDLHPILKITDRTGNVLEEYHPLQSPIFGKNVLPPAAAFIISDILSDNGARLIDFGPNSELKINKKTVSVKTGTTNDFRDNWTIGYTPSYVVATWVGNNDNSPMSSIASGITGAAPIWHDIMVHLLENKPDEPPQRPNNVILKAVCSTSGLLPIKDTPCPTRFEYFIQGTEPTRIDAGVTKVWIDKTTQDIPKPGQTDNLEQKDEVIISDPTGDRYCLTCPHPTPSPSPTP